MAEKTVVEIAIEEVTKAIKGTKIVPQTNNTGTSFFQGKKRLVKVLNTKRGLTLEINVTLPNEIEKLDGMEKISAAKAHQKHLGTMKYLYRNQETKELSKIIAAAVAQFKKDLAPEEPEKPAAQ